MKNQYKYRSLLVFALAIAGYGIHAGTSHMFSSQTELPVLTIEETIVEAPEVAVAAEPAAKDVNPAEELFERFAGNSSSSRPRFIEHMGMRIDLSEIDLLVETEIAAGTIKSRKDIHSFRLKAIDNLALREARARNPTSTR